MLPVVFVFREATLPDTGEIVKVMIPQARYERVAARQFVIGEEYPLVVLEARSRASHSQYFAALNDAFDNLAEEVAARFPSVDHLRRWALVETGFFDEKNFECETPAHAKRLAVFIRSVDTYAVIHIHKNKVIVRDAKSQSAASMQKQTFEDSKRAVLDLVATLARTTRKQLNENAGRSS